MGLKGKQMEINSSACVFCHKKNILVSSTDVYSSVSKEIKKMWQTVPFAYTSKSAMTSTAMNSKQYGSNSAQKDMF